MIEPFKDSSHINFVLGPSVGWVHAFALREGGENHTLVSNWGHKIARFNPLPCASRSILVI